MTESQPKRLIEVAFPLREVSAESVREKASPPGAISRLHIWWARRPLAACRAAIFAALVPDPDDTACMEVRKLDSGMRAWADTLVKELIEVLC